MTIIQFNQVYYPTARFNPWKYGIADRTIQEILLFCMLEESGQLGDPPLQEMYGTYFMICNN